MEDLEEERPKYRAALLIGHTLIPDEHAGEHFFIPSWGLDLEYWFQEHWGMGLHSDVELESYVVFHQNGSELMERNLPVVVTLDALFKPWRGLVLQVGPGIELERSENLPLVRMGLEYEIELRNHWDLSPTIFYDGRFHSDVMRRVSTWSVALGVGKRF